MNSQERDCSRVLLLLRDMGEFPCGCHHGYLPLRVFWCFLLAFCTVTHFFSPHYVCLVLCPSSQLSCCALFSAMRVCVGRYIKQRNSHQPFKQSLGSFRGQSQPFSYHRPGSRPNACVYILYFSCMTKFNLIHSIIFIQHHLPKDVRFSVCQWILLQTTLNVCIELSLVVSLSHFQWQAIQTSSLFLCLNHTCAADVIIL